MVKITRKGISDSQIWFSWVEEFKESKGTLRWVLWVRFWVFVDLELGFHVDWRSVTISSSISNPVMLRFYILLFYFSVFVSIATFLYGLWVYAVFHVFTVTICVVPIGKWGKSYLILWKEKFKLIMYSDYSWLEMECG